MRKQSSLMESVMFRHTQKKGASRNEIILIGGWALIRDNNASIEMAHRLIVS